MLIFSVRARLTPATRGSAKQPDESRARHFQLTNSLSLWRFLVRFNSRLTLSQQTLQMDTFSLHQRRNGIGIAMHRGPAGDSRSRSTLLCPQNVRAALSNQCDAANCKRQHKQTLRTEKFNTPLLRAALAALDGRTERSPKLNVERNVTVEY